MHGNSPPTRLQERLRASCGIFILTQAARVASQLRMSLEPKELASLWSFVMYKNFVLVLVFFVPLASAGELDEIWDAWQARRI